MEDVYFTDSNNGTIVGDNGTILRTVDGGQNWNKQSHKYVGLQGVSFTDAKPWNDCWLLGTILRTTNGGGPTSVGEEEINEIPTEYLLSQNFPNPFNPSTKISWQSPVASHQSLKVYDILGNEIATLVDEYKPLGRYDSYFRCFKFAKWSLHLSTNCWKLHSNKKNGNPQINNLSNLPTNIS